MVYAWAVERLPPDEDKINQWHADLVELLPWQDTGSDAAAELESASFMNMMSKG